jgi:CubicO group peptidase (beta-lactamase class C family)
MTKIGELYRRDGIWNGQQIVPSAWIQQCTSPSTYKTKIEGPSDEGYGLLWWIIDKPKQAGYYALGFGGQLIIVLPKSRAVIVYLTDVQPGSAIDDRDLEPLDNVLISAFPP